MSHSDDEIIEMLEDIDHPAYSTSEIGDLLDMTTEGARNRLKKLEQKGEIIKKKSSPQCTLWWLPKYDSISDFPRNARSRSE